MGSDSRKNPCLDRLGVVQGTCSKSGMAEGVATPALDIKYPAPVFHQTRNLIWKEVAGVGGNFQKMGSVRDDMYKQGNRGSPNVAFGECRTSNRHDPKNQSKEAYPI